MIPNHPSSASVSPAEMAAKRKEREEKQAEVMQARHKLALAFAEVFGHAGHRTERQDAVMKNLRDVCCLDATTASGATIDAHAVLLLEGRRQIGLHIQSMLDEAAKPPA